MPPISGLMDAVNATGEVFLSHTRLHDRVALRIAIGHLDTAERHVRRAWELLQSGGGPVYEHGHGTHRP